MDKLKGVNLQRFLIISELALVFLFYNYFLELGERFLIFALIGFAVSLFIFNLLIFKTDWKIALLLTFLGIMILGFSSFFKEKDIKRLAVILWLFFLFIILGFYTIRDKASVPGSLFKHKLVLPQFTSIALIFFTSYTLLSSKVVFQISSLTLAGLFLVMFALISCLNLSLWGFKKLPLGTIYLVSLPMFLELFIILEFIPIAILGRSLLAALNYYIFSGLIYLESLPVFDKKLLRIYITITLSSAILILMIARWK